LSLCEEFITILNYLMSAADKVNIVLLGKGRDYFLAKCERNSTVIFTPALNILVGI
jgi:hypothetical protein